MLPKSLFRTTIQAVYLQSINLELIRAPKCPANPLVER
jgi:hypothetical protein